MFWGGTMTGLEMISWKKFLMDTQGKNYFVLQASRYSNHCTDMWTIFLEISFKSRALHAFTFKPLSHYSVIKPKASRLMLQINKEIKPGDKSRR